MTPTPSSRKPPVVIIAGSGFEDRLGGMNTRRSVVETPFGNVPVLVSSVGKRDLFVLKRHGEGHSIPPHMINYRANIKAAKTIGAEAIIASTAVGVISTDRYQPRDLILGADVIPHQLQIEGKPITFFHDFSEGVRHPDCTEVFSKRLGQVLATAARDTDITLKDGAVLLTAPGPRYETPAEIRMFESWGANLVGMTTAYEAILATELEIEYAVVAIGTNFAAGRNNGNKLSHPEVLAVFAEKGEELFRLMMRAVEII